jgi:hypothetical protein
MGPILRLERDAPMSTAWAVWRRWLQSALVASVGLAMVDLAVGGGGLAAWGVAVGTALLAGGAVAAAWGALIALTRGWRPLFKMALWLTVGVTAFAFLASSLGAFVNLGGHYHRLALGVIAACSVGALFFGALTALVSPGGGTRQGWLMGRGPRTRYALGASLMGTAGVAAMLDRTLFPGGYASAHLALAMASIYLTTCGVFVLGVRIEVRRRWLSWPLIGAAAALVVLPFILLDTPYAPAANAVLDRPLAAINLRALRRVLDVDGDGYAHLLGDGDCAPLDAAIGPGAREIPGNGIDDNCLGGDAKSPAAAAGLGDPAAPESPSPADILLVTIDTLRPDRMSAYGYTRDTTPNLARFTANATRFDAAYSVAGWTSIAVPAFMRGLYARRLQWHLMYETTKYRYFRPPVEGKLDAGEKVRARFLLPLEDPYPTLAAMLARRGPHAAAVVDGGFTEILAPAWGAGAGFHEFDDIGELPRAQRTDRATATHAIRALRRLRKAEIPFFLWVHFFGPHAPSATHKGVPRYGPSAADRYDHEVRYMDGQLGRLLSVASEPTPRPMATLITSDHGERFFNAKSRGHGWGTTEDYIRIPLIVRAPGLPVGTVATLASSVDLAAAILHLTETPVPPELDGLNLADVAQGTAEAEARVIFFDTFGLKKSMGSRDFRVNKVVALQGRHKLVANRISGTMKLSLRTSDQPRPHDARPDLTKALLGYLEKAGGVPAVDYGDSPAAHAQ